MQYDYWENLEHDFGFSEKEMQGIRKATYQLMLSLVDGTKEVTFDGEELPEADSEWNECVNYIKKKLSEHFNGEGEV